MTTNRPMGVLDKSSELVRLLADDGPLSPGEIAQHIGMPRSSVYRLVDALNAINMTETLPDSNVRLTLRWLKLADSTRAGMREWVHAHDVLDDLAKETGQTTFLSVPRGHTAVCIDWVPGSAIEVLVLRPGKTLPLHAGAAGRVTLAHLEDPESYLALAPFEPFTAHTLVDAAALRADMDSTRTQGFSISDQDVTDGIGALGVAVTSAAGHYVGALSLAGLSDEISGRRADFVEALVASAGALSAQLS
jgi:IclR family transcriptional regulator, acetate operon repressor